MKNLLRAITVGALLVSCAAFANDSTARVATGGLVLEKTNDIKMVSEVLEISPTKIRVTYHFLNTSSKDIRTTVAFPMPAFYETIDNNVRPLDTFEINVNGKTVAVQKERRFLIGKVDVTDKLRKIGLTDDQIFDVGFPCWHTSPENTCLHTRRQVSTIDALQKSMKGNWAIQETAYWEQTFPAGKDITVMHDYTPFTGFHYGDPKYDPAGAACVDAATDRLIARRHEVYDGQDSPIVVQDVEYILGTGRNWKGPIRHFKLVLRKESPNDVVSLCFPGKAVKTSPTTIEFSQTDYVPQDKLIVYFYPFH